MDLIAQVGTLIGYLTIRIMKVLELGLIFRNNTIIEFVSDLSPSTRMTSSHQDQMAISENIYAPLTTNQFPMAVDDSEQTRQYDIIDSNSSSMYALIED